MFSLISNLYSQRVSLILRNVYKSLISLDKLYPNSKQSVLEKPELTLETSFEDENVEGCAGPNKTFIFCPTPITWTT